MQSAVGEITLLKYDRPRVSRRFFADLEIRVIRAIRGEVFGLVVFSKKIARTICIIGKSELRLGCRRQFLCRGILDNGKPVARRGRKAMGS